MGKKKKKANGGKPIWCYYCEREFESEKILIQHQKAKHFKCHVCHKKLSTAGGMVIHVLQVHKVSISKVPNAKPERESIDIEIFGMEGIPADILAQHGGYDANEDEKSSKVAKVEALPSPPFIIANALGMASPLQYTVAMRPVYVAPPRPTIVPRLPFIWRPGPAPPQGYKPMVLPPPPSRPSYPSPRPLFPIQSQIPPPSQPLFPIRTLLPQNSVPANVHGQQFQSPQPPPPQPYSTSREPISFGTCTLSSMPPSNFSIIQSLSSTTSGDLRQYGNEVLDCSSMTTNIQPPPPPPPAPPPTNVSSRVQLPPPLLTQGSEGVNHMYACGPNTLDPNIGPPSVIANNKLLAPAAKSSSSRNPVYLIWDDDQMCMEERRLELARYQLLDEIDQMNSVDAAIDKKILESRLSACITFRA